MILKLISNFLSLAITKIIKEKENKMDEQRSIKILHYFRDITHQTHLRKIFDYG